MRRKGGITASFARENALIIFHGRLFSCQIGEEVARPLFTFTLVSKEAKKCLFAVFWLSHFAPMDKDTSIRMLDLLCSRDRQPSPESESFLQSIQNCATPGLLGTVIALAYHFAINIVVQFPEWAITADCSSAPMTSVLRSVRRWRPFHSLLLEYYNLTGFFCRVRKRKRQKGGNWQS